MSDAADAVVEGSCCAECGVFFTEPNGFPAVCPTCAKQDSNYPLSVFPELSADTHNKRRNKRG